MNIDRTIDTITANVRACVTLFFSAVIWTYILAMFWGVVEKLPPTAPFDYYGNLPMYLLAFLFFVVVGLMLLEFIRHFYASLSHSKSVLFRICKCTALLTGFSATAFIYIWSTHLAFSAGSELAEVALKSGCA